ncbi:MAG TPA: hypothetical protein VIT62_06545 [Lysobacter sp.]
MKPQCIEAVSAVYGREATPAEIRAIESRLARTMRQEATRDPQEWLSLPQNERLRVAADAAAREIQVEAQLKLRRQAQQVLATAKLQQARAEFPGSPLQWLDRTIAFHADAKGSVQSMEYRSKAIERDALRQMIGTLEATNPSFFGMIEDPAGIRDLVRELHGESTGNKVAADGAKQFRDIAEALRVRFNRAGGDIGRLEDWGMPHHHSQVRVARAGQESWRAGLTGAPRAKAWAADAAPPASHARETWVHDVMPALDRQQYLRENGTQMDDIEVSELLGQIWTTIATGGANKTEPGRFAGTGMRANRGNESRQLHFRSADAYLDYQMRYGEKAVYDVLVGHIAGLSNDISAVEVFGPNPDHAFRMFHDEAVQSMTVEDPASAGKVRKQAVGVENLYNLASGKTLPVASQRMAAFFDNLRNTLVANRLGSAVITSITDEGTMMRAAAVNNLPQVRLWSNELRAMNPTNLEGKRLAQRAGLALNTLVASLNRFGNDTLGSGWSSKMATATLRASGLNAMTDARRRAFGVTYMSSIGHLTRTVETLAGLDPMDNRVLLSKGISDADFEVWRRAELEDWGGGNETMLTPESIYRIPDEALADLGDPRALREEAATKLLGTVLEETDLAVIEPGLRERAITRANMQRGTLTGELMRSVWLFKSFPLAMITKHWERALSEPTAARRVRALSALVTTSTILGMVALQASALRDGKDPYDTTDARVWGAALLKGGALSIFGDFLFSQESQSGRGLVASMLGPVVSLAEEMLALTWGNAIEAAQGEETDFGAELVKFGKGNTPVLSAVMNLWYTRAAFDHLILHDLQEALSPGYLDRMRQRTEEQYGQSYFWEPGGSPIDSINSGSDFKPERAPDLAKAVGED